MKELLEKLLEDKEFKDIFKPMSDEEVEKKGLQLLKKFSFFKKEIKQLMASRHTPLRGVSIYPDDDVEDEQYLLDFNFEDGGEISVPTEEDVTILLKPILDKLGLVLSDLYYDPDELNDLYEFFGTLREKPE